MNGSYHTIRLFLCYLGQTIKMTSEILPGRQPPSLQYLVPPSLTYA